LAKEDASDDGGWRRRGDYDFTNNQTKTHTKTMSTTNHKPATTSDILSNPQTQQSGPPSTPDPRHSFSATRARCGKVARLPKEIRDQLNEMLLDGIPHAQIIQKLKQIFGPQPNVLPLDPSNGDASSPSPSDAQSDFPLPVPRGEGQGEGGVERDGMHSSTAPESPNTNHASDSPSTLDTRHSVLLSLTPHHLTTWKKFGGYRDWLKDQQRIADCKMRHELTLDLARSAEGLASYQAAPKVAVAEICQTIVDLGPEGLKEAMQASPLNCFRLLNAMARLINSGLKCETHIQNTAVKTTEMRGKMTRSRFARIEKNMNLL
jgi:hypothetical protein